MAPGAHWQAAQGDARLPRAYTRAGVTPDRQAGASAGRPGGRPGALSAIQLQVELKLTERAHWQARGSEVLDVLVDFTSAPATSAALAPAPQEPGTTPSL
jgi:hypothetical protein